MGTCVRRREGLLGTYRVLPVKGDLQHYPAFSIALTAHLTERQTEAWSRSSQGSEPGQADSLRKVRSGHCSVLNLLKEKLHQQLQKSLC